MLNNVPFSYFHDRALVKASELSNLGNLLDKDPKDQHRRDSLFRGILPTPPKDHSKQMDEFNRKVTGVTCGARLEHLAAMHVYCQTYRYTDMWTCKKVNAGSQVLIIHKPGIALPGIHYLTVEFLWNCFQVRCLNYYL